MKLAWPEPREESIAYEINVPEVREGWLPRGILGCYKYRRRGDSCQAAKATKFLHTGPSKLNEIVQGRERAVPPEYLMIFLHVWISLFGLSGCVLIKKPWKLRFGAGETRESFEVLGSTWIGQPAGSLRIAFGRQVPSE